jgi:glycyl-tRNA synthetase beta subunit
MMKESNTTKKSITDSSLHIRQAKAFHDFFDKFRFDFGDQFVDGDYQQSVNYLIRARTCIDNYLAKNPKPVPRKPRSKK